MSSSTSNFKNNLKSFLVIAILLGALDLWQRLHFFHQHIEAAMLRNFPAVADGLARQRGTSMILLGNSLTQNGYDMPLLKSQLDAGGHADLHIEKVALSGSNPIEWYHNFDRNFVRRGETPAVIVINMSPSGIADSLPAGYRIGWLANETDWQDVPEVLCDDLHDAEVNGQYLQARLSMLYATRWDLRTNILSALIPNVPAGMNWVNDGQGVAKPIASKPPPATYSLLTRLLSLAQAHHARAILVAMPARETYEIDKNLPAILDAYHALFIDGRLTPGLTTADFEDHWHLNPQGAKIFTTYMAQHFPAAVASLFINTTTTRADETSFPHL